jgi:dTDP-4-dehydrorhamnose 3,5-epimerase
MIFTTTKIPGVVVIEPEPIADERGFFARSFCRDEFRKHGLETEIVQCNISHNRKKGTLRGMHYQVPPFEEAKIVSCTQGSIYDVVADLRKGSATCGQWVATEISATNYRMVYVPRGCAHGFQTLEDNAVVYYQMTGFFHPECARGIRWDDRVLKIDWPIQYGLTMSEKDTEYDGLPDEDT